MKRLTRSRKDKMLGGVCGGIAEYFDIDATIVRLLFVLLGVTWFAYLVLYVIMPEETNHDASRRYDNRDDDFSNY